MPENNITNNQHIEDMPGFRDAVNNLILDMLRSGQATDALLDAMNGEAQVGMQAQPPPPPHREQFDKTDARLPQLIRFTRGTLATDTKWEICIPGSSGTPGSAGSGLTFATRNGVAVQIADGELTCIGNGPWWNLENVYRSGDSPIVKSIWATVCQGIAGSSKPNWPVDLNGARMKFYSGNDISTAPDSALAAQYGLQWQLAAIDATTINVINQWSIGKITDTGYMGDADVNTPSSTQAAAVSSVKQVSPGVFQALNVGLASPISSSNSNPVWARVGGATGYMTLMDPSGLGSGGAGSEGDADVASPSQYSVQTLGTGTSPRVLEIYGFSTAAGQAVATGDLVLGKQVSSNKVVYFNTIGM